MYASEGVANKFSDEAKFGQYLFQGYINLAEVTLSELSSPRGSTLQARTSELAPGCLPTTLHTIRVKAFMNCAALVELAIPPSLRYIGSRAFLDCTALRGSPKCHASTNGEDSMLKKMLSPFVPI